MKTDYLCNVALGNTSNWDSLKISADAYLRAGNYSMLRNVRIFQAELSELTGNTRHAILCYCAAFYMDLNGFKSLEHLLTSHATNFAAWQCSAHVDENVIMQLFRLCSERDVSDDELLSRFCSLAFQPKMFQYHIFTIRECQNILLLAKDNRYTEIDKLINNAKLRFLHENVSANK